MGDGGTIMKLEWKQVVIALILGVALGTFGALRYTQSDFHAGWKNPEKFHQRIMERFTSKLKLTSDQQQKMSEILESTRSRMDALRQEAFPKFRQIRESSKAEIRALLTPEQQIKFDAMAAEREARFEKRRGGRRFQSN